MPVELLMRVGDRRELGLLSARERRRTEVALQRFDPKGYLADALAGLLAVVDTAGAT